MKEWLAQLFNARRPKIAEAALADTAAFAALHGKSFQRGWSESEIERLLIDPLVIGHRIGVRRRCVGFILSRRAADEAEILSVAIDPERRGRGLATQLLDFHLRRLAGVGVSKVFLEVDEANAAARRLYARAGFQQVGSRARYYPSAQGEGSAALVLRRDL